MPDRVAAVVAAAGRGKRMGGETNKQYLPLGGRPLLAHTLKQIESCREIQSIILVVASGEEGYCRNHVVVPYGLTKVKHIVAGGSTRQSSVARGLALVGEEFPWVLVHDGARPFIQGGLMEKAIGAARQWGAAACAVPVVDTMKYGGDQDMVRETVPRSGLWAVQTPQVFSRELLANVHERAEHEGINATDDASLVENYGHPVKLVTGDRWNLKITTPEDLELARLLVERSEEVRVGIGYDVHRFAAGRDLVIGGVIIPYHLGLLGHSDADVLIHSLIDALLGAAGKGDIGRHFPDDDSRFTGIASALLLEEALGIVCSDGYTVRNVDMTVIAEKPKLAPYLPAMTVNLAGVLRVDPGRVNIKATTTEGLGFTGRGEGIAAMTVASLTVRTK